MAFVEVAKADDVPSGQMRLFKVQGKEVLVVNYEGKLHGIGGRCSHMNGELSKGRVEGKLVTCPRHGSVFDVTTGECVTGPKIVFLKFRARAVPTYEVRVEGGSIQVSL
ncbi:MAG: Rieske (2Fe-2S) protein [Chloroflexi bacterium]|nr:Rieske (2Fe-2S) protein [Chloroflexota bacterium]